MKKRISTIILALLATNLLIIGPLGTVSASSMDTDPSFSDTQIQDDHLRAITEVYEIIENNLSVDEEGIHIIDEATLIGSLDNVDLSLLQAEMEENGVVFEVELTPTGLLNMYTDYISETNAKIEEGLLVVLSEGSIVENDDSFSLQANVNKDVNFWWGRRRFKSKANARGWAANIRAAGHLNAAAAIGATIFGLGVGGAPNTLGAIYAYNLSDRIDYHNARTNRGIVANLHFTQTFTIKPQ